MSNDERVFMVPSHINDEPNVANTRLFIKWASAIPGDLYVADKAGPFTGKYKISHWIYCKDGRFHREDGQATKDQYWLDGKQLTFDEFYARQKDKYGPAIMAEILGNEQDSIPAK